jgi:CheY-like chemotaxis protein
MITKNKKVLIVDDCHEDNYLLQQTLRDCGVEQIEILTSGGEAAKYVAGLPPYQFREMPDLIFVDINMAGIDGLHLIRWLQRDPVFKSIPMIVLSGSSDPGHQADALAMGATAYHVKPNTLEELRTLVETILQTISHPA